MHANPSGDEPCRNASGEAADRPGGREHPEDSREDTAPLGGGRAIPVHPRRQSYTVDHRDLVRWISARREG